MNKYLYIFVFAVGFCCSCKREPLLTYNTTDNIYFNQKVSGVITDSATVSFAVRRASVNDSVFRLPLAVTGLPSSADRTYIVMVVDSNTTAVTGRHFIFPANFTIRAGHLVDSLRIRFIRTPDLQSKAVVLKIRLQPGGDFNTDIRSLNSSLGVAVNALTFKFLVSDILIAGNSWTNSFAPYFGVFSVKKLKLINQVTGMPLDYHISGWTTDLQYSAKLTLYAIAVRNYLREQMAAGNTVYEDDAVTEIKMGSAYQ